MKPCWLCDSTILGTFGIWADSRALCDGCYRFARWCAIEAITILRRRVALVEASTDRLESMVRILANVSAGWGTRPRVVSPMDDWNYHREMTPAEFVYEASRNDSAWYRTVRGGWRLSREILRTRPDE